MNQHPWNQGRDSGSNDADMVEQVPSRTTSLQNSGQSQHQSSPPVVIPIRAVSPQTIRQAFALYFPDIPERFGWSVDQAQNQTITLSTGTPQSLTCPDDLWQTLYSIVLLSTRGSGYDVKRHGFVVDQTQVAYTDKNHISAWVNQKQGTPVRTSDPSDTYDLSALSAGDSTALIPMDGKTFDVLMLYGYNNVPRGVRYVGLQLQDGIPVLMDGPDSPGAPVLSSEAKALVKTVLADARKLSPQIVGVVVEVRTRQVYAATYAALMSAVVRQTKPMKKENRTFKHVTMFVPGHVENALVIARSYAISEQPVFHVISSVGLVLAIATIIILFGLTFQFSVRPIEQFINQTPSFAVFSTDDYRLTLPHWWIVPAISVTVTQLLAWFPTIVQHLAFLFSRARFWFALAFGATLVLSLPTTTMFFMGQFFPNGFGRFFALHPHPLAAMVIGGGLAIGSVCFCIMVALIADLVMEIAACIALMFAYALLPAVPNLMVDIGEALIVGSVRFYRHVQERWQSITTIIDDYDPTVPVVYIDQDGNPL